MNPTIEITFKAAQAYNAMCKPLCQELKLPQTAFDILMFLANNPDCTTARDIVEIRKIKANLVSVNVDRLVQEGYLERRAVAGDRRQRRKQGAVVGAAASKTRVPLKARSGCWVPQPVSKGYSPLTILKKKSKHKKASAAPVGASALTLFSLLHL